MKIRSFIRVEAYNAKLDWLTVTAPSGEGEASAFHAFARDYMKREEERMGPKTEAYIRGYSGIRVGDTQHVRRGYDGHEMIVASGERSNRLAEEIIAHEAPAKVRRIDARLLAECCEPVFNYPELLRREIIRAREEAGKAKRKKLALFDSSAGNDGITVGSRSSTSYLRIYDHEAKHGVRATGKSWAHEAEFKAEKAELFFQGFRTSGSRADYCAGVMHKVLRELDIPCEWLENMAVNELVVGRKITTNERRLNYQRKVGVPMLMKLVEDGHIDDVRDLLRAHGLDKLFVP